MMIDSILTRKGIEKLSLRADMTTSDFGRWGSLDCPTPTYLQKIIFSSILPFS